MKQNGKRPAIVRIQADLDQLPVKPFVVRESCPDPICDHHVKYNLHSNASLRLNSGATQPAPSVGNP